MTTKDAHALEPGDTFEHAGTLVTVLHCEDESEDRFGRRLTNYQATRLDTGATGRISFGHSIDVMVTMSAMTGPPNGILDRDAVSALLGIEPGSVTRYVARGDAPKPDGYIGRSPWWYRSTITQWAANRPGRGAGGGRPRKTQMSELSGSVPEGVQSDEG